MRRGKNYKGKVREELLGVEGGGEKGVGMRSARRRLAYLGLSSFSCVELIQSHGASEIFEVDRSCTDR